MSDVDGGLPGTGDGRGGFFAIDRRVWAQVYQLGMNALIAYLVIARGTGGDNRTSKWSVNAVERRTGISRSRAAEAIATLERAKVLDRDPTSARMHPKYKIASAHEIPGCEGYPPPSLDADQQRVFDAIKDNWVEVPTQIGTKNNGSHSHQLMRWGSWKPRSIADSLVKLGRASKNKDSYRAILYDLEGAIKPDWIWLPNALVDGANDETAPVELLRQTGSIRTLRLIVDLYRAQSLDEDRGIHFRWIRQKFERHKIGERAPYVVWGFVPGTLGTWRSTPFVTPFFLDTANDTAAWKDFWTCWGRLTSLGLIEMVAHLVHTDTDEGEILHPLALDGTGLLVEREITLAARCVAETMLYTYEYDKAIEIGVTAFAPVLRHIEGVQLVGIARLRYRPKTNRTRAFMGREAEWHETIARLWELGGSGAQAVREMYATSRVHQGDIKEASKVP